MVAMCNKNNKFSFCSFYVGTDINIVATANSNNELVDCLFFQSKINELGQWMKLRDN